MTLPAPIRVLLVDDHRIVREGLRALLHTSGAVDVIGEAQSGHDAVALARQLRPDVVLMDLSMPGGNGIEATEIISKTLPETKVLVLSMHDGAEYVRPALRAGAAGYVVKGAGLADLVTALRAVADGQSFLSPAAAAVLVKDTRERNETQALSPREREIVALVARGLTSVAIGDTLGIAAKTVEGHRANVMAKLQLHDLAALVRFAVRENLVALDE